MTKKIAVFFRLPFENETICIYENGKTISIQLGHVLRSNQDVICLNFDEYIQNIPRASNIPKSVFDMNLAVRILCGLPASKFNGDNAPWKGISCLGKHLKSTLFPALKSIEKGKFGNYSDWMQSLPEGWAGLLIEAVKKEYSRLTSELESEGLLAQFLNVEAPLKCKFAKVGVQGILVDHERLDEKYGALDYEYYKAVKDLEILHGFIVRHRVKDLSYESIKQYIDEFDPKDFSSKYFWESIELMQESSDFLKSLLVEHRNSWDLSELLRISSSLSGLCKIDYDIFGTVSGRILLNRPGIQYLKRTSRDIFSPQKGYAFVYGDYAQFEPGILASFSQDCKLINLYNEGDLYLGLAKEIGNGCTRKIAKEMFLSFIYGMSKTNIKKRITKKYGLKAGDASDDFFSQFSAVEEWKDKVIELVKQSKIAKGAFGYIRRVTSEDTDNDIGRWAPNHLIQSTASGIFKDAICEISSQLPQCRLLVPMHDAILLECPSAQANIIRSKVEIIMTESFKKVCKDVNVRISFEPFSHDN